MIAHKTKAAMPGRLYQNEKLNQGNNTQINAGGQRIGQLNIEPADFIQLLRQSPKVSFAYNSLTPLFFLTLGKKGGKSNPTLCFLFLQTDYRVSHIRALTIQYVEYAVATKKTTAIASRHLPCVESGITHSSGSALAFLRCRRLISPSKAATTNCPVLSPGSFNCSIEPAISCGTLAAIVCDFRLTALVAILFHSLKGVLQYVRNKKSVQHLTCSTPLHKLVLNTLCCLNTIIAKPGSARTLTGL